MISGAPSSRNAAHRPDARVARVSPPDRPNYRAMGAGGSLVTRSLPPGAILGRNLGGRSTTMIRKHFRVKRLILGLAVVFAIAAVTAPAVPAMHGNWATGGAQ